MKTPQQIFDETVRHLVEQGRKSSKTDPHTEIQACVYRHPSGDRCAAGFHIDKYSPDMELKAVRILIRDFYDVLPDYFVVHMDLLDHLQGAHDSCDYDSETREFDIMDLRTKLLRVAVLYNLSDSLVHDLIPGSIEHEPC